MGKETKDGERECNLQSVWEPGEFSSGVFDRGPKENVQVPAMRCGARGGKAGHGAGGRREKAFARRLRLCEICRQSFEPEDKWRKQCEICYYDLREARLTCPSCGEAFPRKAMELVTIAVRPGMAGSKKLSVLYCSPCLRVVKARSTRLAADQASELKKLHAAQRKKVRG